MSRRAVITRLKLLQIGSLVTRDVARTGDAALRAAVGLPFRGKPKMPAIHTEEDVREELAAMFDAKGRAVQFHDVKIHFGNGGVQYVQVRNVVWAGDWTRAIDLNGDQRAIEKIVIDVGSPAR